MSTVLLNYVWGFFLVGTLAGMALRAAQARTAIQNAVVFRSEIMPFLIRATMLGCLPWLAMGAVLLTHAVPDPGMFFGQAPPNIWARLWYGLLVIEISLAAGWVVFGKGAALFARHPFLLNAPVANERWLKISVILFYIVFLVAFVAYFSIA